MKKGIVLFTTLLMIMALLSVMMIFLNKTKELQNNITNEFALVQTNSVMSNLTFYFNNIAFDEEIIFYGSKMPFALLLNDSTLKFSIDSEHKYLNINSLAVKLKDKSSEEYNQFIDYLYKYRVRDPEFFVDIILDTIDKDKFEINSGSGSEIVINDPIFRNGKIYSAKHFKMIVDYYFEITADKAIYDIQFNKLLTYSASSIDINFATKELLEMIFFDADQYSLEKIIKHNKIYEKLDELPFDDNYKKDISKGRFGHSFIFESKIIKVIADLNYKNQFISNVEFLYNTKTKKLTDYKILDVEISK